MVQRKLIVRARLGLHARAAANLVRVAAGFKSQITLRRTDGGPIADAKSILSVLMLAASSGAEIEATATGNDEEAAMTALEDLFAEHFGEKETPNNIDATREVRSQGLGVSEGVVIGQVLKLQDGAFQIARWNIEAEDLSTERERFLRAAALAAEQMRVLRDQAKERLGHQHAYIFDAHLLLLEDEKLLADVTDYIAVHRVNAEWAIRVVADRLAGQYAQIPDEYLRQRASDLEDVMQRLLLALGEPQPPVSTAAKDAVIVARDLLPSRLAELDLQHTLALVTDTGGWTSHTAILARGIGLPAVVGLKNFYAKTNTGDPIIVDSIHSEVILHPTKETLAQYQNQVRTRRAKGSSPADSSRGLQTKDGVEISLRANVELSAEFAAVKEFGAQGVGLYRSEFLLARGGLIVSEHEQQKAYEQIAKIAGDDGAIIRLFDLGSETDRSQLREKNPALGLRAIRFGLRHPQVMRTQLRAILRAAAIGKLNVVLPMVTDVSDVKRARKMLAEEQDKLSHEQAPHGPVQLGAMIEVPAAVTLADKIAEVADFLELGTNDLVQYTLAVDRGNDDVADWFRTLHPAVLAGIASTLKAAEKIGIPAIVCGEMASTPAYAVLLVGLGATDLSMTPTAMPRLRRILAEIDKNTACEIARNCLNCGSADEVENLVHDLLTNHWPQLFPAESLPKTHQID